MGGIGSMKRFIVVILIIIAVNIAQAIESNQSNAALGINPRNEPIKLSRDIPLSTINLGNTKMPDVVTLGMHSSVSQINLGNTKMPDVVVLGKQPTKGTPTKPSNEVDTLQAMYASLNNTSSILDAPLNNTSSILDAPLNNTSSILDAPLNNTSSIPDVRFNNNFSSAVYLPINQTASLIDLCGTNFNVKYYNKSKFYYLTKPTYRDIVRLIGIGFIEKPKGNECGQRAAYLEWLLKRHGINASIVVDENFPGIKGGHAWVEVTTFKKEVFAIDASGFTELAKNENFVKKEKIYKISPCDTSIHKFKDIDHLLTFYGNSEGSIDFTFDWWNTEWGRRILTKTVS
jgi:hypothetical protein